MQKFLLSISLLFAANAAFSQTIQEISTGAGYKKQAFVNLKTGLQTSVADNGWDIAFSTQGQQDAGIFLNESSGSSMGVALARVEAWSSFASWADVLDPADPTLTEILNDEQSWQMGAFNADANLAQYNFGWGAYNPGTHAVEGTKVFVLKLRDGSYRKLQIQSLVGTTYTFRYANLDGTGEATKTVNKADHTGKTLAYFSLATGATTDVEPATGWDIEFCRYVTTLWDPGTSTYIHYNVTGILSGKGVTVAKVLGIDPATVQFNPAQDTLKTCLDEIGHDWKTFNTTWSVDDTRVYFLKAADGHLWKLHFIDFEGSTTGTAVLEKTDLGLISATENLGNGMAAGLSVFPNPARAEANVVVELPSTFNSQAAQLTLLDASGRAVFAKNLNLNVGLNGFELPLSGIPAGAYFLTLELGGQRIFRLIEVE